MKNGEQNNMLNLKKKKIMTLMLSASMAASILGTAVVSAHSNDRQLPPIQTEQQQNEQNTPLHNVNKQSQPQDNSSHNKKIQNAHLNNNQQQNKQHIPDNGFNNQSNHQENIKPQTAQLKDSHQQESHQSMNQQDIRQGNTHKKITTRQNTPSDNELPQSISHNTEINAR